MIAENSSNQKLEKNLDNDQEKEKDEENTRRPRASFYSYVKEYSEYSTIAGFVYIFMDGQTIFGKLFWASTIVSMISLGMYWISVIYLSWQQQLVLTTISSTSQPISDIPFPSVVVCSDGYNVESFYAGILKLLFEQQNPSFVTLTIGSNHYTPLQAARILMQTEKPFLNETLDDSSKSVAQYIKNKWPKFIRGSFPNLTEEIVPNIIEFGNLLQTYSFVDIDSYLKMLSYTEKQENMTDSLVRRILNPALNPQRNAQFNTTKARIQRAIKMIQTDVSYKNLAYALWHSKTPCFDIPGISYDMVGSNSLLRSCSWKGREIPCPYIFNQMPTDFGMCCSFNVEAADATYYQSQYTDLLKELQVRDFNLSKVKQSDSDDWFHSSNEPTTQSGVNMGLLVMLDSHTDLLEPYSIQKDFNSFTAFVKSPGEFPLSYHHGVSVKKGHKTTVALSATTITSDDEIRKYNPSDRGCFFIDEISTLNNHRYYTIQNCFLECTSASAQNFIYNEELKLDPNAEPCVPWYLPAGGASRKVCDPWQSSRFFTQMQRTNPQDSCTNCLADCNHIIYSYSTTYEEIRDCDENNLGSTFLCNLDVAANLPKPQIWAKHVLGVMNEIKALIASGDPSAVGLGDQLTNSTFAMFDDLVASDREITSGYNLNGEMIFKKLNRTYDAYLQDIGFLNVVFDNPTMMVYNTRATQGWIDFFSNVGGILGLCIGLSMITVVEVIWFWVVL